MKVITIGRHEGNDVVIQDPYATRHHMQIIRHDDGHYSLADFGSTNGTFINGQRIRGEVDLYENDVVRIGNTTIPWRLYFEEEEQEVTQYNYATPQCNNEVEAVSSNPTKPNFKERHGFVSMKKKNKIFIVLLSISILIAIIRMLIMLRFYNDYDLELLLYAGSIVGAVMLILGICLKSKLDNQPVTFTQPNGDQPGYLGPFRDLGQNFLGNFKFRKIEDTYVSYTFFMLILPLFPTGCYRVKSDTSGFRTTWLFYGSEKSNSSELLSVYLMLYGLIIWFPFTIMAVVARYL